MIRVVHPRSRIRMLTFSHPGSRIQGSKRHPIPDPASGSATLTGTEPKLFESRNRNRNKSYGSTTLLRTNKLILLTAYFSNY
jgi:hypothetical protein